MRILFVCPYVPSRIRIRSLKLIQELSVLHEISLVCLVCNEYETSLVNDVAKYCSSIDLVSLSLWQAYANCVQALLSKLPLRVAYYQSKVLLDRVVQVIRTREIDVVHGELIKVAPLLHLIQARERMPVIYDAVDCISSYLQQEWLTARNSLRKAFAYAEFMKMRRYERHAISIFRHVAITSVRDRDFLIALGANSQHVYVVPNGIDTEYFAPRSELRASNTLVFCAKLDYYPNSQAILRFCKEILPRIWKWQPQVKLLIVGNNPPPSVCTLGSDKRITITGYVPDIRPYLGSATIALAPLLITVGVQNKVLEALAMATPLVASPASCRALQVKNGVHLLLAEGTQAYADAVLTLLANPQLAQQLGHNGRRYVEEHHRWRASAAILNELYVKGVGERQ